MFEIRNRHFGTVATAANYTEGVRILKEYAEDAGASVTITFTGGFFTCPEFGRYTLAKAV